MIYILYDLLGVSLWSTWFQFMIYIFMSYLVSVYDLRCFRKMLLSAEAFKIPLAWLHFMIYMCFAWFQFMVYIPP